MASSGERFGVGMPSMTFYVCQCMAMIRVDRRVPGCVGTIGNGKKYVMEHNRFADASLCPIAVAMLDGKGTQVHKIFQFLFIPSLDVVTFDNVTFLPMPNCP